ncbi:MULTISPECIES: hypothetical protein [unclassified Lysobacter]|uniref:hypothetical protein n=1 Tax=unclassified Lysobacter TaxID=2635362 RepID=UPI001BE76D0F|nr:MULTISPECIES: hypothetical protein [unclassified Lysobacter]MBT2747946.1 hypothetical protein [Lysobacter sp. ISL-42]MBT2753714.1 hypothetical protein [Lysobacter sp. ISL-50]MBT2779211.1 hypothetical protein [Lysobacter sp. ISL-54]
MSYDLMLFDPSAAPRDRAEFLRWYRAQVQWSEPHDYRDPATTCAPLAAVYFDLLHEFPNLHAIDSDGLDEGNLKIAEYSFGYAIVYIAFRWPVADAAYSTVSALAEKHGVGFFDVTADYYPLIWFPPAAQDAP